MKPKGWDVVVLDDPEHEHLIAELHFDGEFVCLLERELGRNSIRVEFDRENKPALRVLLGDFIEHLNKAAEDLRR